MKNSPSETPMNGKAMTSLILGLLAIASLIRAPFFGVMIGSIGVISGIVALKEVQRLRQSGQGIAIAGIAFSMIGFFATLFFIIRSFG